MPVAASFSCLRACLQFVTGSKISAAPAITFLWVKTFPLKVYAPLILPMCIVSACVVLAGLAVRCHLWPAACAAS